MHDRLRSVKASRNLRNICLALSLAFLLEFLYLLYHTVWHGQPFAISAIGFLLLGSLTSLLTYYFHVRFRNRD